MFWGMMLTDLGKAFANTVSLIGHSISQLIGQFIYLIWTAIARFADALESIFLRLAGVQVKDGDDLASNMINNPQIQQLFWNLVAVSTAIMIFFTIIKIVQENYKEKNGGNPYVIVFRMFKGMLMFFFVTGAVLVGLMASGVVFTLLKDATGSGSQKVSGTIFNAMAYDANRARLGKSFGATDYDKIYYDKIVGIWNGDEEAFGEKKGQYRWIANDASMLYKLTSQGVKVRTASEVAADTYADLLKYAIVNGDGSYQSVAPGFSIMATSDTYREPIYYDPPANTKLSYREDSTGQYWFTEEGWLQSKILANGDAYSYEYSDNGEIIDQDFSKGNADWQDNYSNSTSGWELSDDANDGEQFAYDLVASASLPIFTPVLDWSFNPFELIRTEYQYGAYTDKKYPGEFDYTNTFGSSPGPTFTIEFHGKVYTLGNKRQVSASAPEQYSFNLNLGARAGVTEGTSYSIDNFFKKNPFGQMVVQMSVQTSLAKLFEYVFDALVDRVLGYGISIMSSPYMPQPSMYLFLLQTALDVASNQIAKLMNDTVDTVFNPASSEGNAIIANLLTVVTDAARRSVQVDGDKIKLERIRFRKDGWEEFMNSITKMVTDFQSNLWNDGANGGVGPGSKLVKNAVDEAMLTIEEQDLIKLWGEYYGLMKDANNRMLTDIKDYITSMQELKAFLAAENLTHLTPQDFADMNLFEVADMYQLINKLNSGAITGDKKTKFENLQERICNTLYEIGYFAGLDFAKSGYSGDGTWSSVKDINLSFPTLASIDAQSSVYKRETIWKEYGSASSKNVLTGNAGLAFSGAGYIQVPVVEKRNTTMVKINFWDSTTGSVFSPSLDPLVRDIDNFDMSADLLPLVYGPAYRLGDRGPMGETGKYGTYPLDSTKPSETIVHGVFAKQQSLSQSSTDTINMQALWNHAQYNVTLQSVNEKSPVTGNGNTVFRNMETGETEVVMDKWVTYEPQVILGDDVSIFNLQGVSMRDGVTKMALTDGVTDPQTIADMIDRAMMAARRDISLFDQFSTDANSNSNSGNIIGYASYLSLGAVSHLYALWEISYLVGYVGIVITIGVYLNFTFGLIQRILHLGVLYVMSPLTIAFYPFDNGERFTSSFVKPFYKQAISGYAIILSMNLFYVFLAVVRGKDLYGTGSEAGQGAPLLLGTLLTVSVMTMLPKIRDTVREILGADSISEKKLGEVFKDAGKIAASPFKAMAKPVGGLTHIGRQIHANRVLNKNKREDKGGYNDWKKSRGKDEKGGFLGLKGLRAMNKKKKELGIKNSVVKTLWGDSNSVLAKTKAFQGAYKLFDPREKDKEYLKYAQDEQSLVAADERAKNLAGVQNAYGAVWTYEQKENGLEDKLKNKVFTQEEIAAKGLTDEEIKTKADKNRNEWMKEYGMNDVGVTEKAKQELAREKEGAELKEKMNKEFEALQASLKLRFGVKIDRDDLKKIKDQLSIVYDLKNTPKQRADAQAKAMDILLKKSTNAGDTHEAFKRYQFISKTETNLAGAEFAKIIEQQLSRVDTSVAAALMTDTKFNADSARDKAKFCEDMSEILHANYGGKTEEEEKEFKKNAVEKYINDNNYDNETVTKVMSLEKKLADFEQFGHIQAQIVGDKNGPISGAGTTAMQNAVAVVYELGMLKKAAEQLQGLITAAGQEQNAIMNRQESLARGAELIAKGLSESAVDFAKAANEKCNTIEEFRTELVKVTQEMATRNTANPELEEKFERLRACLIDNPADLNTKRIIDQLSQSIIDSKNMDLHGSREAVLTSQQSQIQGQIAQNLQHVEQNAVQ